MAEVNIKAISLRRAWRWLPPFVHVQSAAEKRWWNPDRSSVFWSVLFSLPIHFSPPSHVCHASSLSLSRSLSPSFYLLLPCLIISQRDGSDGWTSGYLRGETMETRHLLSVNTVWSSVAPHKDTTQLALFNSLLFGLSISLLIAPHPPTQPPTPSTSVSKSLCASQTFLISRFDQNNWRWPCC